MLAITILRFHFSHVRLAQREAHVGRDTNPLKCPRQRGDRYVLHSVAVQNAPADTDNALSSIRPRKLQDNLPQHKTTRPADTVRLLYKKFCWK